MTSKFNKLYNMITQEIAKVLDELPEKAQQYIETDKWKYQKKITQNFMKNLFIDCKKLCFKLFPEYDYYLQAIFQECQLIFSCKAATIDLYGQLLPDGNIEFNLYPVLEVTMLNNDKEKIKEILYYSFIFPTIPHQIAHIIDIAINGRPLTEEQVHRESWKEIYQAIMQYYT